MKIGIVGLGLIGGSAAKAYKQAQAETGKTAGGERNEHAGDGTGDDSAAANMKERNKYEVFGYDRDVVINDFAVVSGAIDGVLCEDNIGECDLIILAVYPGAAVEFLRRKGGLVKKGALVVDFCGTKRTVCREGFEAAEKNGFVFVGGHPMAGTQYSGLKHSKAALFKGASIILVPPRFDDIGLLERVKRMLAPLGFSRISVTHADYHDAEIAYTSQLAHVVSNAYVKSPSAQLHKGYSAGSYRDLTRVAWLNEKMWTELFLENREYLLKELSLLINSLEEYREALSEEDGERLERLLREGRECKERADG